jgi:selenocysteine-specific elongation factor
VIIATAGHVDHGKTALVKQLTGVDTDRLEEEKRRGLSISLGYAYLPRGGETPLGFIDVPGHQRFINNMISGIGGIDMGLLVVAADDGPMPQTREHLDVLQVLGVEKVVAVVSKVDRADSDRSAEVEGGLFRLSVDRAFTIKGAGVVVTGTSSAGTVHVGDLLCLQPGNIEVRVRGLRVHDREADTARAGQRCALNLAGGVEVTDISRGDWLVSPDAAPPSRHVDVSFALLPDVPFALKHLSPVKLYIGAGRYAGRIALLRTEKSERKLHAGESALAQLVLETAVPFSTGQRFLLRDQAENVLLGGGRILDPEGGTEKKAHPERLAWLDAMCEPSPEKALARILTQDRLVDMERFRLAWNLSQHDELALPGDDALSFNAGGRHWLASRSRWTEVEAAVMSRVKAWHREHPHESGIKANVLRQLLGNSVERPLLMAVVGSGIEQGVLGMSDGRICLADFSPAVPERQLAAWQEVQSCLARHGKRVPLLSELTAETGISVPEFEQVARNAIRDSRMFRVSSKRYALPGQLLEFSREVIDRNDAGEPLSVVALKCCWGVGRNLAVEILEYFDSIRFTRREGDVRVVVNAQVPLDMFNA